MANGDHGLKYWMRWQVPVCALFIVIPAAVATALICRVKRGELRASDFWVPCWRGLHPLWLLAYRAAVFVFMFSVLCLFLLREGLFAFFFYTQWTFALVIVYFAIGTFVSAGGCWAYFQENHFKIEESNEFLEGDSEDNGFANSAVTINTNNRNGSRNLYNHQQNDNAKHEAEFWGYTMQIIYQTCAGSVMLTDIVFWGIIVPFLTDDHFKLSLLMAFMHSLNLIFLLIDTSLNSMPFPFFRMVYFVLWSCAYVIFQWILHACGFTWWPYPFLQLSTGWAPLWYFGLALVHIPCYGFYFLVAKAKNSLFSKIFPRAYLKSY